MTEHDADQCNVLAQNVASHYYLIVLLPCLTFSQKFHNNFSIISQQFLNNFTTYMRGGIIMRCCLTCCALLHYFFYYPQHLYIKRAIQNSMCSITLFAILNVF